MFVFLCLRRFIPLLLHSCLWYYHWCLANYWSIPQIFPSSFPHFLKFIHICYLSGLDCTLFLYINFSSLYRTFSGSSWRDPPFLLQNFFFTIFFVHFAVFFCSSLKINYFMLNIKAMNKHFIYFFVKSLYARAWCYQIVPQNWSEFYKKLKNIYIRYSLLL